MRRPIFVLGMLCAVLGGSAHAYDTCPIGFAAVNIFGQNGATGGGDGPTVNVTTKANLVYYAGLSGPYTILVSGSFSGAGDVSVTSDKSIIGLGAGATFSGFGLDINTQHNIIIRNITILNAPVDAIATRYTHHVWIDHCDLSSSPTSGYDGLIDLTYGSDYITVSNTYLHDHDKCSLVNSGTGRVEDVGKLHITYHNNWFDTTIQRNPRVGYGPVHVFNNYYTNVYDPEDPTGGYCVGYHTGAKVLVENNYFYLSNDPLKQMYTVPSNFGDAESIGNVFDTCTGNTIGTGVSFDPELIYDYAFALDSAANVPTSVQANAGPKSGCDFVLVPTPGNGSIDYAASIPSLSWTNLPDALSWNVYFGTTTSPAYQTNQTGHTWSPGALAPNTTYYWKVDTVKSGSTVTGQLWRFRTAQAAASKPYPADNQTETPLRMMDSYTTARPTELTWAPGLGAVAHDVYFGTSPSLGAGDYKGQFSSSLYAPGLLGYGITYYWRIDTVLSDDSIVTGPLWQFTTNMPVFAGEGRTEAESMVINLGYWIETWSIASGNADLYGEAGPGVASIVYSGDDGICDITVTYFDESDGESSFSVFINGALADMWEVTANNDQFATRTLRLPLLAGDEIAVQGCPESNERAHLDCIDIAMAPGSDDVTPPIPSPMTWAVLPHGTDYDAISMTAATATDDSGVEYNFTCTSGNGHNSGWQDSPTYTDTGLAARTGPTAIYTYIVTARDKSSNNNQTAPSSPASSMTLPLTTSLVRVNFQTTSAIVPAGYLTDYGDTFASRTCGLSYGWNPTHTDLTRERNLNADQRLDTICHIHAGGYWEIAVPNGQYDVEVAVGDPSFDSTHTIRVEGTTYWNAVLLAANVFRTSTKTVTVSDGRLRVDQGAAADKSTRICYLIITAVGATDSTSPIPNPLTWAAAPTAISSSSITMTAFTASDASGVEYFFDCTSGSGHDSAWQDSSTYTDTGLANNAGYTYRVKARDKSAGHNETGWSAEASAATPRYSCTPLASDLNSNCQVDFADFAALAGVWSGEGPDFAILQQFAAQWLICNRSPAGECWQ